MKHGSITTRQNQKDRQLSGQQPVKAVQKRPKTKTSAGKMKKVLFGQDPCHKSMKMMVKLNALRSEILSHPPYSQDLALSDYWLFSDLKRILQGKRFRSNEEVIAKIEAYFKSKDKSFYKKGFKKLEERLAECITLEKEYLDK
ncbi:putative DD34D transposase [Trichonephila clavipes]|nr:putative DD34D transposase [Trichonephila clavipes]